MKQLIYLLVFLSSGLLAQQTDTVFILATTDVHGCIQPYDYFKDQPADLGLAKAYTKIADFRRRHKNIILLDAGDLLQGTPLTYLFNHEKNTYLNPMILTLNYMGYDAFAVGNHDIEQGVFVYEKARAESRFSWLSANSLLEDGRTYFEPYTILERNDIRIGVIGLTTPGIPMWLDESLYPGITWTDMVSTAKKYCDILKPEVDILIGLFHAGFDSGYSAEKTKALNIPNENASGLVAAKVPGFDVIFAGHSHKEVYPDEYDKANNLNLPLKLNAGHRAKHIAIAQIVLRKVNQQYKIINKRGWLEPAYNAQAAESIIQLTDFFHQQTLEYTRREIAEINGVLDTRWSRVEDTPAIEQINKAQMAASDAQISFASSFNNKLIIEDSVLKVKDIYSLYPYENYLYVINMTGEQIRKYIEYSTQYYLKNYNHSGESEYIAGHDPDIAGYNYDMAEGINYTIRVNRTMESRQDKSVRNKIVNLTLSDGSQLEKEKYYRVAVNSYRASGGGGFMNAAGIKDPEIIWKSNREIRTILIDYFQKEGVILQEVDDNWKVEIED
ncbi:MAG: 5'-nucleotidase C-terminal domain-containing protein [Calditrichaceae bacterium]|nr:5'-nucleotidase C-terminal domain-containing protein [Calditrichaceae bacterium]MBN2707500.1 5'-nucleotidase C-terminal domain-containing protein [Calditrichaceae bacterium]RQV95591.1 MAG: bifunctional metallophosphatase/5'-nucleotidase [Calditrichota bacterium]